MLENKHHFEFPQLYKTFLFIKCLWIHLKLMMKETAFTRFNEEFYCGI